MCIPSVEDNTNMCMPHHTTPHHTTSHHTTPHHTTTHHTTLQKTTAHHTREHHSTPHHFTPHHTTPRHTILHCISGILHETGVKAWWSVWNRCNLFGFVQPMLGMPGACMYLVVALHSRFAVRRLLVFHMLRFRLGTFQDEVQKQTQQRCTESIRVASFPWCR